MSDASTQRCHPIRVDCRSAIPVLSRSLRILLKNRAPSQVTPLTDIPRRRRDGSPTVRTAPPGRRAPVVMPVPHTARSTGTPVPPARRTGHHPTPRDRARNRRPWTPRPGRDGASGHPAAVDPAVTTSRRPGPNSSCRRPTGIDRTRPTPDRGASGTAHPGLLDPTTPSRPAGYRARSSSMAAGATRIRCGEIENRHPRMRAVLVRRSPLSARATGPLISTARSAISPATHSATAIATTSSAGTSGTVVSDPSPGGCAEPGTGASDPLPRHPPCRSPFPAPHRRRGIHGAARSVPPEPLGSVPGDHRSVPARDPVPGPISGCRDSASPPADRGPAAHRDDPAVPGALAAADPQRRPDPDADSPGSTLPQHTPLAPLNRTSPNRGKHP